MQGNYNGNKTKQQRCRLLLLSIACESLCLPHWKGQDLQAVFAHLCSSSSGSSSSSSSASRVADAFIKLCKLPKITSSSSSAATAESSTTLSSRFAATATPANLKAATLTAETHLVSELMFELVSAPLASIVADWGFRNLQRRQRQRQKLQQSKSIRKSVSSSSRKHNDINDSDSHDMDSLLALAQDLQQQPQQQSSNNNNNNTHNSADTSLNLEDTCSEVVRSLQIFDQPRSGGQSVLTALATVLVTFTVFRMQCFLCPPSNIPRSTSTCERLLQRRQSELRTFLGDVKGQQAISRAYALDASELARAVCELLGIPVPEGGVAGLVRDQCAVDVFLDACNRGDGGRRPEEDEEEEEEEVVEEYDDELRRHQQLNRSRNRNQQQQGQHRSQQQNTQEYIQRRRQQPRRQQRSSPSPTRGDATYLSSDYSDDDNNDGYYRPNSRDSNSSPNNNMKKKSVLQERVQAIRDSRDQPPQVVAHTEDVIHKQCLEVLGQHISFLQSKAANCKRLLKGLLHLWKAISAFQYNASSGKYHHHHGTSASTESPKEVARDSLQRVQDLLNMQSREAASVSQVRQQQVHFVISFCINISVIFVVAYFFNCCCCTDGHSSCATARSPITRTSSRR